MTEPERAALDHIRQVVDSVIGVPTSPVLHSSGPTAAILPVPYLSQFEAGQLTGDSGAVAGTMLVRAYTGQSLTPADFYEQTGQSSETTLSFAQIANTLNANGLPAEVRSNLKLADLCLILFTGRPIIALVNQAVLQEAGLTPETFHGPHYLVVLGYPVFGPALSIGKIIKVEIRETFQPPVLIVHLGHHLISADPRRRSAP